MSDVDPTAISSNGEFFSLPQWYCEQFLTLCTAIYLPSTFSGKPSCLASNGYCDVRSVCQSNIHYMASQMPQLKDVCFRYVHLLIGCQHMLQVSEAIRERAKRIYDKYGNVMLEVKGMTKAGVERKATCRALFSKLLYLAGSALNP